MPSKETKLLLLNIIILLCLSNCNLPENQNAKAEEYSDKGINLQEYSLNDEAIPMFKKAIELSTENNPNRKFYYRNLANIYFEESQLDSCLYYSKLALKHCVPNSYDYFYLQGDINLLKGDIRKGIFNLKKACRIKPNNTEANNSLGLIYLGEFGYKKPNYKLALKYNLRAYESSNSSTIKAVLANNYYWLDSLTKSKTLYTELIEFNRHDLRSMYYLGLCHYQSDEKERAKELFTEVVMRDTSYIPPIKDILAELEIEY